MHCDKFELSRKDRRLKLERKPLELLVLLVTKHGQVVTRDEIARRLWEQEVFVDVEHGINTAIRKIRRTLGDSPDLPQFVQTLSGSGYRFIATVTAVQPEVVERIQFRDLPIEFPPATPEMAALPDTAALPEVSAALAISSAGKPGHRSWLVAALCALVLVVVATLTLGPIVWLPASSIETVTPPSARLLCCLSKISLATRAKSTLPTV